jgi:hypothetical protein
MLRLLGCLAVLLLIGLATGCNKRSNSTQSSVTGQQGSAVQAPAHQPIRFPKPQPQDQP